MEKWMKRFGAYAMVLVLLFAMAACGSDSTESTTTPPTETTVPAPTEDPQQLLAESYNGAVAAVGKEEVGLQVKAWRYVTLADQTYKQMSDTTIAYWNLGEEDFLAKVSDSNVFGNNNYAMTVTEIFSGETLFQSLDKSKFTATLTQEEFTARYAPVQMLDPSLYTITASQDGKTLEFTDPVAGESWCVPENATLVSAGATVVLDDTGKLSKTDYEVTYEIGGAQIKLDYEVSVTVTGRQPVVPANVDAYVQIDDPYAIYAMEHAYGYLLQATHVSSHANTAYTSMAAATSVQIDSDKQAYHVDDCYGAKWTYTVGAMDLSTGQTQEQEIVEKVIDGVYTQSVDGGRDTPNNEITQDVVQGAITTSLVTDIMKSSHVAATETTLLGDILLFTYTGNEEAGEEFCATVNSNLFSDPDFLDGYASKYETKKMEAYVALNVYTMLPVAAGVDYEGMHLIEGTECALYYQSNNSFDLASLTAYEEVFETSLDPEPEKQATPLFYHVTGADGQEMWLLGTIHAGDERTAHLPQQIYDALYASDALALEYDSDAFAEEVKKSEELQKALSNAYYYSDGSTMKDHIVTEDLYEAAEKMMKASGNYSQNAPYMRPHLWSTVIEDFKMQQGYQLTKEKGVDNRLSKLATEAGIPIRSVENSLEHVSLMGNYSDNLQEVLLYSAITMSSLDYSEAVLELYENWCAGDEAALKASIAEEGFEIKEEDISLDGLEGEDLEKAKAILADLDNINAQLAELYEEYTSAMSAERNEEMIAVAKQYLESGDTVFYAVGLSHLLDEDGLLNNLRAAGYTVELVTYS